MNVIVYVYMSRRAVSPGRPEKGIQDPGAGISSCCDLPDVGAENQIQILCKNSNVFQVSSSQQVLIYADERIFNIQIKLCIMFHLHFLDYGRNMLCFLSYRITKVERKLLEMNKEEIDKNKLDAINRAGICFIYI